MASERAGTNGPDRRARVLHAARETVLQLGYDKAGMRDIAARANLSKSAIYLDFASKEALVDELIRTESVAFATALFAAADSDATQAAARVAAEGDTTRAAALGANDGPATSDAGVADAAASAGPATGFGPLFAHTIALLQHHPFLRSLLAGDEGLLGGYVRRHRGRFLAARSTLNRALLELLRRQGRLRPGIDADAAAPLLMMLAIGYVETPLEVAGDRTGTVLQEMGRLLDTWLLADDAPAFAPGELPALLRDVLAAVAAHASEEAS